MVDIDIGFNAGSGKRLGASMRMRPSMYPWKQERQSGTELSFSFPTHRIHVFGVCIRTVVSDLRPGGESDVIGHGISCKGRVIGGGRQYA